jgi:hypothetical protein
MQLVIDLVHRRDALQAERAKLTAKLDEQIKTVEVELSTLTGGDTTTPAIRTPANGAKRTRKHGIGQRLYSLVAATPSANYSTLATQLYGSDSTKNRNRLRSLMMTLKKSNLVRQVSPGKWAVAGEH